MASKRTTPPILTPGAIEMLRALEKASTNGIQAILIVPETIGEDYDSLILADLIEVRSVARHEGHFRGQASPHVFILPAGIAFLRKLDSPDPSE